MALDANSLSAIVELDMDRFVKTVEVAADIGSRFVERVRERDDVHELAEIMARVVTEYVAERAAKEVRIKTIIAE